MHWSLAGHYRVRFRLHHRHRRRRLTRRPLLAGLRRQLRRRYPATAAAIASCRASAASTESTETGALSRKNRKKIARATTTKPTAPLPPMSFVRCPTTECYGTALLHPGQYRAYARRPARTGLRNMPVKLSGLSATTSGEPWATTSPPPSPPKRTKVNDPVGRLDHVEIVFDHQHGVALINQRI